MFGLPIGQFISVNWVPTYKPHARASVHVSHWTLVAASVQSLRIMFPTLMVLFEVIFSRSDWRNFVVQVDAGRQKSRVTSF
jgi:hypothetical protein